MPVEQIASLRLTTSNSPTLMHTLNLLNQFGRHFPKCTVCSVSLSSPPPTHTLTPICINHPPFPSQRARAFYIVIIYVLSTHSERAKTKTLTLGRYLRQRRVVIIECSMFFSFFSFFFIAAGMHHWPSNFHSSCESIDHLPP